MSAMVSVEELQVRTVPAILLKAREERAQRLMMVYAITGLFFMLLPGTFLGVWNLISISGHRGGAILASWIQAHGHAQIFGWIGTFILGIGFYSIPKMTSRASANSIAGAGLPGCSGRQVFCCAGPAGFYHLYWRVFCRFSALLEFCAFLIFLVSVRGHRPSAFERNQSQRMPVWMIQSWLGQPALASDC